jgi:glyoxylase-like metal-dependent hydrolase (beta-lactamase superfamily II)
LRCATASSTRPRSTRPARRERILGFHAKSDAGFFGRRRRLRECKTLVKIDHDQDIVGNALSSALATLSAVAIYVWLPSAEFVASETEFAFWSAPDLADKLPPEQQPRVTQANLKLASPRLRLIKAKAEVVPGVTTFGTPGHTPGHLAVNISSGREQLLLTGDVVVNSAVSFLHPEWPFGFDIDVPLATKTRMAFLDRAAADKTLVGSYHLPFPGFGHVVREGGAYRWLPADWRWTS